MAVYAQDWNTPAPANCGSGGLAIGNFDGVHRGHAALVAELRRQAHALGGPAVALTFEPHPLQLLRPDQFEPVLTTVPDRAKRLHEVGADHVIVLETTQDLLDLCAAEFFDRVVRQKIGPRVMVEGPNFGFGRGREGDTETLARLCLEAGLGLTIVPPLSVDGIPVSSSRVRRELIKGNARFAATLLGRPYQLRGLVGTGERRGQKLGFPTANLVKVSSLVPGNGVYAVRVTHEGTDWPGAANVGPNPTFGEQARKIEVHLIDFHGDLYGRQLGVEFIDRLRDTRPFAGVEQLVAQLRADVDLARCLLKGPHDGNG
jgi:riboflavin kinase/FMN adenylyltransferase